MKLNGVLLLSIFVIAASGNKFLDDALNRIKDKDVAKKLKDFILKAGLDTNAASGGTSNALSKLTQDKRDIILQMMKNSVSITPDSIKKIDPALWKLLPKRALEKLTTEQKKAFCDQLKTKLNTVDSASFRRMVSSMKCTSQLSTLEKGKISRPNCDALLDKERKNNPGKPASYDTNIWKIVAHNYCKKLSSKEIAEMPFEQFKQYVSQKARRNDRSLNKAIATKVKAECGDPSTWTTKEKLEKAMEFLKYLSLADLNKVPVDTLTLVANKLLPIFKGMDPARRRIMMAKLNKNKTAAANSLSLLQGDPRITAKMTKTEIENNLSTLKDQQLSPATARKLVAKLIKPTTWSKANIKSYKHLLSGLKSKEFEKIPASVLKESLADIQGIRFDKQQKEILKKKLKESLGSTATWDATKLKDAKIIMSSLSRKDIESIPKTALKDSIAELLEAKLNKLQKQAIMDKLDAATADPSQLGDLLGEATEGKLKQILSVEKLTKDGDIVEPEKMKKSKALVFCKSMKELLGEVGSQNYPLKVVKKWKSILARCINRDMIKSLSNDNINVADVLSQFASRFEKLSYRQKLQVAKKFKEQMDLSTLTAEQLSQIGPFLMVMSIEDLKKIPTDRKADLLEILTSTNVDGIPRDLLKSLTIYAKSLQETADIAGLGNLRCGLTADDVKQMKDADVDENISFMSRKCDITQLLQRYIQRHGSTIKTNIEKLSEIIGLLRFMKKADVESISNDIMAGLLGDIIERKKEREGGDDDDDDDDDTDKEKDTNLTEAEKKTAIDVENTMIQKAFEGMISAEASGTRKRRAAGSAYTCADLKSLGAGVTALTVAQLGGITKEVMTECAADLGAQGSWTPEQLVVLIEKAKLAFGATPADWTVENLKFLGSIVGGLTAGEIGKLKLDTTDVLQAIGKHPTLDLTKLKAGFAQWLSKQGNTAISHTDLAGMSNFACGATKDHINGFSSASVAGAIDSIGALKSCETIQKQAYYQKMKASLNKDLDAWDPSRIAALGHMLGGAANTDISKLDASRMSVLSPVVISGLPVDVFKGFLKSQIPNFDSSQAGSVTQAQFTALPYETQVELAKSGAKFTPKKTDGGSSSANQVPASIINLVMPMMLAITVSVKLF